MLQNCHGKKAFHIQDLKITFLELINSKTVRVKSETKLACDKKQELLNV